ncbi:MAG: PorT family protein [Chitinophagales bacterium]|nr:PorT family protein [Chitinophagales bacterium]
MRYVHRIKIVFLLFAGLCFFIPSTSGQVNYYEFKDKQIYFGINIGLNFSDFNFTPIPREESVDSILGINSSLGPGFNLGIISNYQFHEYFDLRFVPALSFSDKKSDFLMLDGQTIPKTINSIYFSFPLHLRFKSQPINDFRIFVLGGMRYDFDLASNSGKRKAEDQIKIRKHDLSLEYGIGFSFYFPYFIFSPEFKMSHGILNIHDRDTNLIFSRAIDSLFSRAFTISINLEG